MFKYTLTIAAIPVVIQEAKEKYTPVIIILYLSIYEHKLLLPQINKPTNGKIPTKEQSIATKAMICLIFSKTVRNAYTQYIMAVLWSRWSHFILHTGKKSNKSTHLQ